MCSSLGKGRPSPRGCGPGVGGNGTELAIAETNTMKAYSGRVVQIAREKKRQNNGEKEKVMGKVRGMSGAHQYGAKSPDDIDANGIGMRGGIGQKRRISQHA